MTDSQVTEKARKAKPFVLDLLSRVTTDSIFALVDAIKERRVDGKHYDSCGFGNLAKGYGYDFKDKTVEEIQDDLREFGRMIGYEIRADGRADPIEELILCVSPGDSVNSKTELLLLKAWCLHVLFERGQIISWVDHLPDPELDDLLAAGSGTYADEALSVN